MHACDVGWVYRLLNLVENKCVVERKPFVFPFLSFLPLMVMNPKRNRNCAVLFFSIEALRALHRLLDLSLACGVLDRRAGAEQVEVSECC
jgi:hypothetical protein